MYRQTVLKGEVLLLRLAFYLEVLCVYNVYLFFPLNVFCNQNIQSLNTLGGGGGIIVGLIYYFS